MQINSTDAINVRIPKADFENTPENMSKFLKGLCNSIVTKI
jgi:hypothetical protein